MNKRGRTEKKTPKVHQLRWENQLNQELRWILYGHTVYSNILRRDEKRNHKRDDQHDEL